MMTSKSHRTQEARLPQHSCLTAWQKNSYFFLVVNRDTVSLAYKPPIKNHRVLYE